MSKRKREEEEVNVKGADADVQEPAVKKLKLDPLKLLHKKVFDNPNLPGLIDSFLGGADKAKLAVTEKKRAKWHKDRPERLKEYRCVECKLLFSYKLSLSDYDPDGNEYSSSEEEDEEDEEETKKEKKDKRQRFCDDCMPESCNGCHAWFGKSELEHCDIRDKDLCEECILMDCVECESSVHPDKLDERNRCDDCHENCARCGDYDATEHFYGTAYCAKCFQIKSVEHCRTHCR
jgi:hypothetical protein